MTPARGWTALVTGASGGIGRAVAEALARRGMRMVITGRDEARLAQVKATLPASANALAIPTDLADDAAVATLATRIGAEAKRLDVLVHAAGAIRLGRIADASVADLDEMYRVNLRAPFLLTRLLLPLLTAARGQIVLVSSTAALAPGVGNGLYAATKQALSAFAKTLRDEVNGDGIRVLAVFPGRTATPMMERVAAWEGTRHDPSRQLQPADVAEVIAGALASASTAEVTEIVVRPMQKPMG